MDYSLDSRRVSPTQNRQAYSLTPKDLLGFEALQLRQGTLLARASNGAYSHCAHTQPHVFGHSCVRSEVAERPTLVGCCPF
jgi:hypothetical protein